MRGRVNINRIGLSALLTLVMLFSAQQTIAEPLDTGDEVRAYLIGDVGWGMLAENVFSGSINDTYLRYGGGFGMQHKKFFAEFTYKTGGESWRNSLALTGFETPLSSNSSFTTQELAVRFGVVQGGGRLRIPVGVSIGYITFDSPLTLDGIPYDVETSGWYIGPWVGAEVRVTRWLGIGVSVEYSMGVETRRAGPQDLYYTQPGNSLPTLGGPTTTAPVGMGFFDTVGFFSNQYEYSNDQPGYLIQVRTIIYLPEL